MNISNENARADSGQKCSAGKSCNGCEFSKDCHESKIYAADLLEARELIKEMLTFISTVQLDTVVDDIKAEGIVEKAKDYV